MLRRVPSRQRNTRVARERDRGMLLRLGVLLLCGLSLAGGFVYAGGQHFAALKLGYETENLRKIRNSLVAEQDRLVVAQQAAASPARLERAARQIGMQPMQAAQIDPLKRAASSSVEKNSPAASTTVASPKGVTVTLPKSATVTSPKSITVTLPKTATLAPAKNTQAKLTRQPKP
jgi:cell division protein FtsL